MKFWFEMFGCVCLVFAVLFGLVRLYDWLTDQDEDVQSVFTLAIFILVLTTFLWIIAKYVLVG